MSGVYVHIPFCHSKCAYCDFFSTPSRKSVEDYVDAVIKEARLRIKELMPASQNGDSIETIYIGGGTPSILPLPLLRRLIEGLFDSLRPLLAESIKEFTIEANPEDLSDDLINDCIALGVNRISMGVQTFDDDALLALGRRHDGDCALKALHAISASGLNYSADLIFGLPGQTIDDWSRQLERLLSFRPPHFSAYLLSYEPGTRLYAQLMAGKVEEASDELAEAMYDRLISAARANGYEHYEISNYSMPGFKAKHNSSYWDGTPYLGLGVSAHSFDGLKRRFNPNSIKDYIASINRGDKYYIIEDESEANRFNDALITALRTSNGLDLEKMRSSFSAGIVKSFEKNLARYGRDIVSDDNRLYIPEKLWLKSDAILRDLIVD